MKRVLLLLALVLAAPLAHAGNERVDAILEDQRVHGYDSPLHALQRLEAASDAPRADAPIPKRMAFEAARAAYATQAHEDAAAADALRQLDAMAATGRCATCRPAALLVRAQVAAAARRQDEATRAITAAERLVPRGDTPLYLELLLVRARFHDIRGELTQGIADGVAALDLAERLGNVAAQVRAMTVMVGMNADLGDFARAEALAREAWVIAERNGFTYMMGLVRMQQGYVHALRGENEAQREALLDALRIAGEDPGLREVRAVSLANLADAYLQANQPREALRYAERAERVSVELHDENGRAVALANRGIALSRLGQHAQGIALLREAAALSEALGAKSYVIGINDELVKAYEASGQLREALATMRRVLALNQEMTRQERDKAVLELQEKYASERRRREIEKLSTTNRVQQAEVEARRWQMRLWATLAVALLLAAIALVRWLGRARRANRKLSGDIAVLSEQSMHDPLTGASNRRHCGQILDAHLSTPDAPPLALMLLDLDFFKRINDTWGHGAGDRVLVEVAARLRTLLRQQDTVVRWGGEEFALVLPGSGPEALPALAERVMQAVAGAPFDIGDATIPVTVSIGAATVPVVPGVGWPHAMHLADLALYMSKSGGRNCATCIVGVEPGADLESISRDLVAASVRGDVRLHMVDGPAPVRAVAAA